MKDFELRKDNSGFTMVELIVSLLVSSFVVLAASFFLSMAIRNYNVNNTEISLQMESQIALNLMENLIIEADKCVYEPEYEYENTDDETGKCPLFRIYAKSNDTATLYLVIHDEEDSMLLLKTKTAAGANDADDITELFDAQLINDTVAAALSAERPALLASYVTVFSVEPAEMEKDTDGLVRVSITLKRNDKEYSGTTNVSMRNGVHR